MRVFGLLVSRMTSCRTWGERARDARIKITFRMIWPLPRMYSVNSNHNKNIACFPNMLGSLLYISTYKTECSASCSKLKVDQKATHKVKWTVITA